MTPEVLEEIKVESLKEFELLSKVYRPSFKTRKICDYLKQRIQELRPGIDVFEDAYRANLVNDAMSAYESSGNLWFDLPANDPSFEGAEPIILQGHMDMVVAYTDDAAHAGILEHGVELEYHGNGTLTSRGNKTSLGADNGIGLGVMLAIIKSDSFKHGPIRFIFTTDEEEGMIGASFLGLTKTGEKGEPVKGFRYLINNDNANDGEMIISTAGAVISLYTIPKDPETQPMQTQNPVYTLSVSGLLGGHDGDWVAKHTNAIRIVGMVLKEICDSPDFQLIEFISPSSECINLLHTQSFATFVSAKSQDDINRIINNVTDEVKKQYPDETGLKIQVESTPLPENTEIRPYSHDIGARIVKLVNSLLFGVVSWKDQSTGWVETSGNMGPIYLRLDKEEKDGKTIWHSPSFEFQVLCRSCNNEHLVKIVDDNKKLAKDCLGSDDLDYYQLCNLFYGWPGDEDQSFLQIAKDAFEARGVKWTTKNLNGGLEISWFKHFNPGLNMVSIGAEIHHTHDCQETLYTGTLDGVVGVTLECIEHMRTITKQ